MENKWTLEIYPNAGREGKQKRVRKGCGVTTERERKEWELKEDERGKGDLTV